MTIRIRPFLAGMIAVAFAAAAVLSAQGVPFWGAKESSPIGTDPKLLKPGQFVWEATPPPADRSSSS